MNKTDLSSLGHRETESSSICSFKNFDCYSRKGELNTNAWGLQNSYSNVK